MKSKKQVKEVSPLVADYQAGVSIQVIAETHGVTVEEVIKANSL
jgi:LysM repeat protein